MKKEQVLDIIFTVTRSAFSHDSKRSEECGAPVCTFANGDYFIEYKDRIEYYSFKRSRNHTFFIIDCK